MNARIAFVRHPEDLFWDGGRIRVVERYKTSGLSGDEWRFSYNVELLRKDVVVARTTVGSLEYAAATLASAIQLCLAELEQDSRWEVMPWETVPNEEVCCQPGCSNLSTRTYVMKKLFDRSCMFEKLNDANYAREFCDEHGQRGDCGLDDANANYVCVKGKDWDDALVDPDKVSESVFGVEKS